MVKTTPKMRGWEAGKSYVLEAHNQMVRRRPVVRAVELGELITRSEADEGAASKILDEISDETHTTVKNSYTTHVSITISSASLSQRVALHQHEEETRSRSKLK